MMDGDLNEAVLVDARAFAQARAEIGPQIARIIGYFREDGVKSVAAIAAAMRDGDAAGLVRPAHTLKGEARQLGAEPLGDLCETIENIGRNCVESHADPDEAMVHVSRLQAMFEATLALLERSAGPPVERRPTFGALAGGGGFGRRVA